MSVQNMLFKTPADIAIRLLSGCSETRQKDAQTFCKFIICIVRVSLPKQNVFSDFQQPAYNSINYLLHPLTVFFLSWLGSVQCWGLHLRDIPNLHMCITVKNSQACHVECIDVLTTNIMTKQLLGYSINTKELKWWDPSVWNIILLLHWRKVGTRICIHIIF